MVDNLGRTKIEHDDCCCCCNPRDGTEGGRRERGRKNSSLSSLRRTDGRVGPTFNQKNRSNARFVRISWLWMHKTTAGGGQLLASMRHLAGKRAFRASERAREIQGNFRLLTVVCFAGQRAFFCWKGAEFITLGILHTSLRRAKAPHL